MMEIDMPFYGIYRGTAMNTADPMMRGRIQVSVPVAAGGGASWAEACRDFKSNSTPPVGTTVWVMYEGGDVSRPVWIGCAS
jgi:type VI secretion system (T6SS) baseplate-like injector VgrG